MAEIKSLSIVSSSSLDSSSLNFTKFLKEIDKTVLYFSPGRKDFPVMGLFLKCFSLMLKPSYTYGLNMV